MQRFCTTEDQRLLVRINEDIRSGSTLEIPDPYQRFYINTEWYTKYMGAVIIKNKKSVEVRKPESK